MTEPTYEYVKGKGWVQVLDHVFTMACGTVVRMEHRKPNPGEKFSNCHMYSKEYQSNGKPKFEEFEKLYKSFKYEKLTSLKEDDWRLNENRVWVTFVPVL